MILAKIDDPTQADAIADEIRDGRFNFNILVLPTLPPVSEIPVNLNLFFWKNLNTFWPIKPVAPVISILPEYSIMSIFSQWYLVIEKFQMET